MGDRLRTGEPSRYVTSHPGQLSLAIRPWVGAMSTSEGWGVNRHTARYTSPVSVVSQCKLVSGWGLRKRRSAPPYGPLWLRKDFTFFYLQHHSYNTYMKYADKMISQENAASAKTTYFRCWMFDILSNKASATRNTISPRNEITPTAIPKLHASVL